MVCSDWLWTHASCALASQALRLLTCATHPFRSPVYLTRLYTVTDMRLGVGTCCSHVCDVGSAVKSLGFKNVAVFLLLHSSLGTLHTLSCCWWSLFFLGKMAHLAVVWVLFLVPGPVFECSISQMLSKQTKEQARVLPSRYIPSNVYNPSPLLWDTVSLCISA